MQTSWDKDLSVGGNAILELKPARHNQKPLSAEMVGDQDSRADGNQHDPAE
jgi:hypothetical protein